MTTLFTGCGDLASPLHIFSKLFLHKWGAKWFLWLTHSQNFFITLYVSQFCLFLVQFWSNFRPILVHCWSKVLKIVLLYFDNSWPSLSPFRAHFGSIFVDFIPIRPFLDDFFSDKIENYLRILFSSPSFLLLHCSTWEIQFCDKKGRFIVLWVGRGTFNFSNVVIGSEYETTVIIIMANFWANRSAPIQLLGQSNLVEWLKPRTSFPLFAYSWLFGPDLHWF